MWTSCANGTQWKENARNKRGDWNFLILFSVTFEGYCDNNTRINSHGKGAINNKTKTKKVVLFYILPLVHEIQIFSTYSGVIFKLNLRSNQLNPLWFLILRCLVFRCLLLAESSGKIQRSGKAFQSQVGVRNSLLREVLCTKGVWQTSLAPDHWIPPVVLSQSWW